MKKNNRREFIQKTSVSLLAGMSGVHLSSRNASTQTKKPNVIFILVDDLGYGDLGCYGQKTIQTPNIDRLAAEGMRFTQHYSGSTVCAPSRCSLMTGKHTGNCTVRGNTEVLMNVDEETLASIFKRNGYTTGCIGKWGIGHPIQPHHPHEHGFDHFFGYLSMWHAHNYYTDHLWRNQKKISLSNVVKNPDTYYKPSERLKVGYATEKKEYSHDLFVEEALQFIDDNQDNPFFLYLPLTIPHANNEAGNKGMEVPSFGIYEDKDWDDPQKGHAAMITDMDTGVGMIMQKLKDLNLDEDTIIIFTSDNGPHKEGGADPAFFDSNGPLRGMKRDLYEGGIRTPLVVRWKGTIQEGSVSDHLSAFWDFLPTFQELVNDSQSVECDGLSILPTLIGNQAQQKQHDYLYWEFHEKGGKQSVRMGKWKGVRLWDNGDTIELYDLTNDTGEMNNIASEHPNVVKKLANIMRSAHTNNQDWHFPL